MRLNVVATPLVNSPTLYISCFRRPSSDETLVLVTVQLLLILLIIFVTTELGVMPTAEGRAAPVH